MSLPGEGLEKLEDMIVRAAETTAAHIRSAKAAISGVIFGQDRVVERALITVLSGGHALLAENDGADRGFGRSYMGGGRLRGAHDHVFQLFQSFAGQ